MTEPAADQFTVLAIDLGTGGPKAVVVDAHGSALSAGIARTPIEYTVGGGAEQDPEDWWRAVVAASRDALSGLPDGSPQPGAVAVTAQWLTTVPVRADGAPVGNAISWMDTRGGRFVRDHVGGPAAGYEPRAIASLLRRTGGAPSLSGRDPVGQIHFLRSERPEVYEAADYMLEPGDYLTARMTGTVATAPECAVGCWSTDNREINNVRYDEKLLAINGLDGEKFAPIVPSNSVVGGVTEAVAAELGVDAGIPVMTSTPDLMAAAVGSGAVRDRAAHLYFGTSGWVSCHVPFKRTDPIHQVVTMPSSLPGRYILGTEQQCVGAGLDHLRDRLLGMPEMPYEELIAEAERAEPGAGGVLFLPWLNGERTPLDDRNVRATYTGLSLRSGRGELVRATLEGVALNARWMIGHSERLLRFELDPIAFIGGGASSELWCQIVADVLNRPVDQIDQPRQANVRGAAMLALLGLGRVDVGQIAERITVRQRFLPDPGRAARYDELFVQFKKHYKNNRRWFAARAK